MIPPDNADRPAEPQPSSEDGPVYVLVDGLLCRLQIWTDAEWDSLPADRRPCRAERLEGLGWLGAVAEISLN